MSRTIVFTAQEFNYVRNLLRQHAPTRNEYLPEELTVYSVFEIDLATVPTVNEEIVPVTPIVDAVDYAEAPLTLDEGNVEVVDVIETTTD